MFYEDVVVQNGETVRRLAVAYGHKPDAENSIWADAKNRALAERGI